MTFSTEDFARALEQHDYQFNTGSVVRGRVISCGSEGAYVDIGGKASAFMPANEAALKKVLDLSTLLPIDDEHDFLVIREQDADGQVLLSLKRLELQQLWGRLLEMQANEATLSVKVEGVNRGGVTVDVEGIRGFIPRSHLVNSEDLDAMVGRTITVAFLEIDRDRNRVVVSEKIAARSAAMTGLEVGQLIEGTVVSLKPFGAFVDFNGATGLLHVKQISKAYVTSIGEVLTMGQPIKAVIVSLDEIRRRIGLSTKILEKYPGEILKGFDEVMADAENRLGDLSNLLADSDA